MCVFVEREIAVHKFVRSFGFSSKNSFILCMRMAFFRVCSPVKDCSHHHSVICACALLQFILLMFYRKSISFLKWSGMLAKKNAHFISFTFYSSLLSVLDVHIYAFFSLVFFSLFG